MKRRKVTNPKPLQGSFQTFRSYIGFRSTFRSDKPKNLDTGHVHVRARGKRRGFSPGAAVRH